jgi:hypothetical protein
VALLKVKKTLIGMDKEVSDDDDEVVMFSKVTLLCLL